ncbi:DAK2 domain-containing protein [Aeromicrobium sp. REDSEA-S38_B2]|jgi:DAK2 domain fusion protein YloV|uniref:DAK2 domain-containing protein n=1 Tax=Aeromicrobium sp. REDSEA-S38_B2 TaxID=1811528 RepID=UPI000AC717EB|nr:DAK2 domain-containing protein [Aeromicrobium sp. REDSEA-S38_B2]
MVLRLRADAFRAWTQLCVQALSTARAEIDALNVFPVPDGDTGTNAYLTFVAGADAVAALPDDVVLPDLVKAHTDGLLMGAKGNSGVILSQLVRAVFGDLDLGAEVRADDVAHAFRAASDAAHAAVGRPVEGTILSVARAAADGAQDAVESGAEARDVFALAAASARVALERTPEQLARLAEAGVVDAGGRALVVVLDATERALTGRAPTPAAQHVPTPLAASGDDFVEGGPAYEVMYLLDAEESEIPALRHTLDALGDSLVVVGGDRLWNVHVHVDDVGAAIEAGLQAGRPYRIAVTHFADQVARQQGRQRSGRAVVVAATGAGLADLCREAGAHVLEFTRDRPVDVATMLETLRGLDAEEVVVLPNNQRYVGLFDAAAKQVRADGVRVAVIPTHAQVQGLAALAVHDPGRDFDEDVVAMSSAAAHTQHGAVTVAVEPGITMAGPCEAGDVLGVVSGDFAVVGSDVAEVADAVLDRLLSPTAELVTLVVGDGADHTVAQTLSRRLREERVDVDVVVYEGGQENYPLFVAVE